MLWVRVPPPELQSLQNVLCSGSTYANCIPELQTELSGLSINWINTPDVGSSSFTIDHSSQISHDCSKLLYGT